MKPFKTKEMAIKQAISISKARYRVDPSGEPIYVVYESGCYHTATEYDLDTFFNGNNNIVFCTD